MGDGLAQGAMPGASRGATLQRGPVRGGILKSMDKKIEFEGTNVEI